MRQFFVFLVFFTTFSVFADGVSLMLRPSSVSENSGISADSIDSMIINSLDGRGIAVSDNSVLVMESSVWKKGLRVFLVLRLYDDGGERLVASSLQSVTSALELSSAVDKAIVAVMDSLASKAPEYSPKADKVFPLVIYSQDEDAVVFMGNRNIGTIKDGILKTKKQIFVSQGSKLRVRVEKEGYYTAITDYVADSSPAELRLPPLVKKSIFETASFLSTGQIMGLGMEGRWYLIPGFVFTGLKEYFFVQYSDGIFARYVVPHNQAEMVVGAYILGQPANFFRIWIESGVGFYATFLKDSSISLDFYVHVGAVGLEFNPLPFLGVFIRGGYDYSLGTGLIPQGAIELEPDGGPIMSLGGIVRW
ncbi:hypothetical protein WKV44_01460 [Spirochaetia bacterium 38H-sp]|uniref:PEGA domain-containing protein n=1 Tax=Rarispira pelagica TaxID=3141764 RepID=A0ABU9UB30_9SPIR